MGKTEAIDNMLLPKKEIPWMLILLVEENNNTLMLKRPNS